MSVAFSSRALRNVARECAPQLGTWFLSVYAKAGTSIAARHVDAMH